MTSPSPRDRAVLTIVAGVVAGAVLMLFWAPQVLEHRRAQALRTETRSAYEAALTDWNRVQAEDAEVLDAVLGPPRYRSRSVRCVLDEVQEGWVVQNYRQVCSMRAVDVYPTETSYGQLSAQLQSAASGTKATDRLAAPDRYVPEHGCGLLRFDHLDASPDVIVVVQRLQAGTFTASNSGSPSACGAPPPDFELGTVHFDETFAAADLTPSQSWVAVTHDADFFGQDLGCRGIIFCNAPVEQPVLP